MDSQRDPEREAPAGRYPPADYHTFSGMIQRSRATRGGLDGVLWYEGCGLSQEAFEEIAATLGFRKIWSGAWVSP